MPGAVSLWLRPLATPSLVVYPNARRAWDLLSVHSANRCVAVWGPRPHGQTGVAISGTFFLNKNARNPIFSVRAWHSAAPSAFAKVSYKRRRPPWNSLCVWVLSARAGVSRFWAAQRASQSLVAAAVESQGSLGRPVLSVHALAHSQ